MKKEQLADNVTLFCGDAREVIPLLGRLDKTALVSDPPYGIEDLVTGYGRSSLSGARGKLSHQFRDKKISNDRNLNVVDEVLTLSRSQLKTSWVVLFYSCRISPKFFSMMKDYEYFGEVIWDKKSPGLGTQIRYQHENVAFFKTGKPPDLNDGMSIISYAAIKGENRSSTHGAHPHEKPHQVMVNIVDMVPGGVVIDPFMGTGSTGAAAVQLKRGFIGIEIDPKHFEVAIKKVSAAIKQPVAFWET